MICGDFKFHVSGVLTFYTECGPDNKNKVHIMYFRHYVDLYKHVHTV